MGKRKLKLYLFSGPTVLTTEKIETLKDRLPSPIDIARRLNILAELGKTEEFEPFTLELTSSESENFAKEINLKVRRAPEVYCYLYPNYSTRGTKRNPAILKIILSK